MHSYNVTVSVVLIEEGNGWWSAQCLEYDIAAQAKSIADVLYEMEKTLISHIAVNEAAGIDPFEEMPSAPQKYWDMFQRARIQVYWQRQPFRVPTPVRHRLDELQFRVADRQAA